LYKEAHRPVMSHALKMPLRRMTVAEFLEWDSGDRTGALWQLRDGKPERMAPASDAHGSVQSELSYLVTAHLRNLDSRVVLSSRRASFRPCVLRRTAWFRTSILPVRRPPVST
jgi:Uma2 family endonuclease